ncbi:MAG: 3-dehydroquinate synthase [Vicinamibacteria bacterium]|nr:3-dehydroquinate synthase [Vicinamibacteria bacterium]
MLDARMIEIPVELGARRYLISIGHGLSAMLPELLKRFAGRRSMAVASRRVWNLHGSRLARAFRDLGITARVIVPDGERYKSRATLNKLHDEFLKAGLARDGLVVAVGGGVVGDLAGFAAATYMRGVDWIPIPTTLLSMVDSSVGGKTGVNHPMAKNIIGAFHQPKAVVVDPVFLETLPRRELQGGAYEVLKSALLGDRALFRSLRDAPPGLVGWDHKEMENAIASSCRIKAEVVEKDEREADRRRALNLGHTIGHALEAATDYRRFTHGEAVGWGIVGVSWIAMRREMLSESAFDAIAAAVDRLGPRPRVSDIPAPRILSALKRDKKMRQGRVHFVLPDGIGRVVIRPDVGENEIRSALRVMAAREARMARRG